MPAVGQDRLEGRLDVRGGVVGAADDLDRGGATVGEGERLTVGVEAGEPDRLHLVDEVLGGHQVGGHLALRPLREVRVGVRLEVVLTADAGVGHDRGARAGLDRRGRLVATTVELVAVEGVVATELVTHLVGDVVDRHEVTLGLRQAGAATGLAVTADDTEAGDTAAVDAQRDVADVVAVGADEEAEGDPVAVEQAAGAAVVELVERVATRRPAGTVRSEGLRLGVDVELVGLVDQQHPDREVVVVDLVDAVHQRHLLRQDVLGAEVARVRRVGDQREAERAAQDLVTLVGLPGLRRDVELVELLLVELGLDESLLGCGKGRPEVGEVEAVVAVVGRVDEPGRPGAAHGGVEAHRRDVEADARARADGRAGVRRDLGVGGGQTGLHHRRVDDAEVDERPVGGRHRDEHAGPAGLLGGRAVERGLQDGRVEGVGRIRARVDALRLTGPRGQSARDRAPRRARVGGGGAEGGRRSGSGGLPRREASQAGQSETDDSGRGSAAPPSVVRDRDRAGGRRQQGS